MGCATPEDVQGLTATVAVARFRLLPLGPVSDWLVLAGKRSEV